MSAVRAYAETTSVSVEKSRAELDTLLGKHGAQQRGILTDETKNCAVVMFGMHGQKYHIEVPLPPRVAPPLSAQPKGWVHWNEDTKSAYIYRAHEQACRARWRAIVMLVRAKLEAVRIGLSSVEREFLSDLMLPNGEKAMTAIIRAIDGNSLKSLPSYSKDTKVMT